MALSDLEKKYFYLVDNGALSSYKEIAKNILHNEGEEDRLRKEYKNKNGLKGYRAEYLDIKKEKLDELEKSKNIKIGLYLRERYNNDSKYQEGGFKSLVEFREWYFSKEQKCHYCGITQDELNKLFCKSDKGEYDCECNGDKSKCKAKIRPKKPSHTATLQIDKQNPYDGYNAKNCVLACSLCNNAKSDMISATNYKKFFGKSMRKFLEKLYKEEIDNDHKPLDTNPARQL